MRLLPLFAVGSRGGGCSPRRAGDSLSGWVQPFPEMHHCNAWAAFSAFLAPLTPELSGEVGECRSVGFCLLLSLHRELQQRQMQSFFRALWGVVPVYSNAIWYFTETLAKIYEALLESFDSRRNSRSHKNMWNSPSYFSAIALRIQCSNCALRHHIMILQLKPRVKNNLSNSDPKGDLGQVIFHN